MRLRRVYLYGRYRLPDGKEVNVHKGVNERGHDVVFYLYRGKRVLLSWAGLGTKIA